MESEALHLVIRVPLGLLKDATFPRRGDTIDLAAAAGATEHALTLVGDSVALWENGARVHPARGAARLSLPSDLSFDTYDTAVAFVARPVPPDTEIFAGQGFLDAHLTHRIRSPKGVFAIGLTEGGVGRTLSVRYVALDGPERTLILSSQSGRVLLNPTWRRAARDFAARGIREVLTGSDQLLFLICLVLLCSRRTGDLVPIVAAFAAGHSLTLIGTTSTVASAGPWLDALAGTGIAASVAYMALRNIATVRSWGVWPLAGLFGLVHGVGLSSGFREQLQFATSHQLVSLLSFAAGIGIGDVAALAVMLAGLRLLLGFATRVRLVVIVMSAIIAHTGWRRMIERGDLFWQADWPRMDAPALLMLGRWLAFALLTVGVARSLVRWVEQGRQRESNRGESLPGASE